LKVKETGWAAFEPGLQQSYRQGEYAAILARAKKSADHYHDWRKHVKTLLYQLRLLCPEWPATGRALLTKLDRLATALGEDHDLALLKDFAAHHNHPKEARTLTRLIQSRQKKLRTTALKLGSQLYRETPDAFTTRLQKPWSAWHTQKPK
jgi:CHAD domain-containing protein